MIGDARADAREAKFALVGVERGDMRSMAGREDEGHMRPEDEEAGGALPHPRLQEMDRVQASAGSVEQGDDGAGRDIRVQRRGAVERVDRRQQCSVFVERNRLVEFAEDDPAHARPPESANEGILRESTGCRPGQAQERGTSRPVSRGLASANKGRNG